MAALSGPDAPRELPGMPAASRVDPERPQLRGRAGCSPLAAAKPAVFLRL